MRARKVVGQTGAHALRCAIGGITLQRVAGRLGVPADDLHERAVRLLGEEAQP